MSQKSAIVIGAGIVGLATARALAVRNYQVTVIERNEYAIGASIRNFGMIWPIGQKEGDDYRRAQLSKNIWKEICDEAKIWYDPCGSLHLAYESDEWDVLRELGEIYRHRGYQVLNRDATMEKSSAVVDENLCGSLYSPEEMIVDPRKSIAAISQWLKEKYGVQFLFGKTISAVHHPRVFSGKDFWEADEIFICAGADFDNLYSELFANLPVTRCKLQMMRLHATNGEARLGSAICGALSLAHYQSFKAAATLTRLISRFQNEYPAHLKWGIHVMISQMESGEFTVGDSHEYGMTLPPFDRTEINQMILGYLKNFIRIPTDTIAETWNGVYTKMTNGDTHCFLEPEPGVTVINGLGGAGMTLSFGLCEELISKRIG